MSILKSIVRLLPGGEGLVERASYKRRKRILEKIGDAEARFTHIFANNRWKDGESVSGVGSSLATTAKIRAQLPRLIDEVGATRIFDAPCGDYNWFRHIDLDSNVLYIGGDIVEPLIHANNQTHASESRKFVHADITKDELPNVDLWLCRDCLIHLSYDDIQRATDNFLNSAIRYWLTTTHRAVNRNIDIPTGHCRLINLEIEPFNFGPPARYIEDNDTENSGKHLALWEREQLRTTLGR